MAQPEMARARKLLAKGEMSTPCWKPCPRA
jgi:hypothetical protein